VRRARCILIGPRCRRPPLEEYALTNDDAGSLAPPTAIGPYRVLHQVGAGVLGPVFRAHSADAGRELAIKLFRLDVTPEQARSVADALGRVCTRLPEHDYIAAPRAAGLLGWSPWLACDYIPADSLDSRLRRRSALGLRHALPILRQIAAALDAAASAGIHHGSLHPRDVLVSTTGDVHVTGFGVADAIDAAGGPPVVRRPYTAPERVGPGRGPADQVADVFALGAIAV
jgi:serine/threonine-protein kinase